MNALNLKALGSLVILCVVMTAIVFIAAGTTHYWQGWTFLAAYFAGAGAVTIYLAAKDRQLLERRMKGGYSAEKEPAQKIIMLLASFAFIALVVLPVLDHRFGWSHPPRQIAWIGDALVILGYVGIFRVFKENTYTSSTIELAHGQRVISTGPYAIVRHPMYASALVMLSGIPFALGSYCGLVILIALIAVLILRLLDEEKFLAKNLPGYRDYQRKVRYRLAPGIW